jgi:arylsulfatase A-like enzyme
MELKGGRRRRGWLLGLLLLIAVGAGTALLHTRGRGFDPAEFTPNGPAVAAVREAVAGSNIVIVVLDAVRADHVGCYGYPRPTTPSIDRLAEQSLLFEQHFSQSSETKSSTSSLFTSQYCDTHLADGPRALIEGTFTLQEGLAAAGFRTVLLSANLKATPLYGTGMDFQEAIYDRDLEAILEGEEKLYDPAVLVRAFRGWLEQNSGDRFYAYLHFIPPHYPYRQPAEMTELFAGQEHPEFERGELEFPDSSGVQPPTPPPLPEWINLYDANLRYGDWAVGETIKLLDDAGALDNTLLIVTSDHGESFGEHGHIWHGRDVRDEMVHIPLLIKLPGGGIPARRIGALTQVIDVLPTICDLYGVPYPADGVQGRSLLSLMAGNEEAVNEHVFSRGGGRPSKYLVRTGSAALILYSNGEWRALYDLISDPGQKANVFTRQEDRGGELVSVFRSFAEEQRRPPVDFVDPAAQMPPLPKVKALGLSPEDQARVRAIADLGYLR